MELINHSYVRLIGKDILTKTSKEKRRMTVKKKSKEIHYGYYDLGINFSILLALRYSCSTALLSRADHGSHRSSLSS